MPIERGDRLIPVQTADGHITVLKATGAKAAGDRVILLQTADGVNTPIRCSPMSKEGQRGILVQTADGILTPIVMQTLPSAVCIAWIDESRGGSGAYYNNETIYNSDLSSYDTLIEDNVVSSGLMSPSDGGETGWTYCIPEGYSQPANITMINCGRPPSLTDIVNFYTTLKNNITPDFIPQKVLLAVDVSGSMNYSTIQPAYGQFLSWLATNEPSVEVVRKSFSNERWIYLLNGFIQNLED